MVTEWGRERRKIGEEFRWHDDIAHTLQGLDLPAAVRMSGSRFSVLKGQVARLERALTNYFLDYFTNLDAARCYEEISVPLIVTRSTLESTG
jgi:seryl-tRNA synthetase